MFVTDPRIIFYMLFIFSSIHQLPIEEIQADYLYWKFELEGLAVMTERAVVLRIRSICLFLAAIGLVKWGLLGGGG